MAQESLPLTYKGHLLRRVESFIFYGTMDEKYIVFMQVLGKETVNGKEQINKISVQLQRTEQGLKSSEIIVKEATKNSLYDALDIGSIWLERALAGKM